MNDAMEVNGESYIGLMPAYNFLSDEDLALILTHIRQHFGNGASPVSEEDVRSGR
jgi:mono/diheme cytochrome c family protein